jgi:hypothetical protein
MAKNNVRVGVVIAVTMSIGFSTAGAEYSIMGPGVKSCADFISDYRADPATAEDSYFLWAQGFMSGFNGAHLSIDGTSYDLSSISLSEQKRMLRDYCDSNPQSIYAKAVVDLYGRLNLSRPLKDPK